MPDNANPSGDQTEPEPTRSLDIVRGLALALMLTALIPGNALILATPAAFGHSGAYEIFLFCSGLAIAPSLLAVFAEQGRLAGVVRVAHRVWQIVWRAIGAMLVAAALVLAASGLEPRAALATIDLDGLLAAPRETVLGFVIMTEQFGFFSQLTSYPMILALSPLVILLARWRRPAAAALCLGLYLLAAFGFGAPAHWRLDPLAWQLAFFAGFAFAAGWAPAPKREALLIRLAIGALVVSALSAPNGALGALWRAAPSALEAERVLGPARLLHFAALAYLASVYAPRWIAQARATRIGETLLNALGRVGSQSLVALVALHPIAALVGAALQGESPDLGSSLAATLLALALLVACVEIALWFRSPPWDGAKTAQPRSAASSQ